MTSNSNQDAISTAAASTDAKKKPLPKLPLPDAILSTTPGTWAHDTMSRRVNEEILERTWQDCREDWEADKQKFDTVLRRFRELRDELSAASTTKLSYLDPLSQRDAEIPERVKEYDEWRELLEPYVNAGDTWLTAPWMVTEFYVYRRLMQALGYWDATSAGYRYDPFAKQKRAGLTTSVGSAEPMLAKIATLADGGGASSTTAAASTTSSSPRQGMILAASIALWGNKMDLSLWPADADGDDAGDVFTAILAAAAENLLHDDSQALAEYCETLHGKGGGNVDIIVDNAGFELVTDLALGQYLIDSGIAKVVTFQLKSHPTFVSDALEKDLVETVEHYATVLDASQYPACRAAGNKWKEFLGDRGAWKCNEDPFWVQPYAMWDMTEPLRSDLRERCDLAIIKGDANYRRLLGDRNWEYTAPFDDVVGAYFPCPVLALRCLKAELGCGMDADQVQRAQKLDDRWLVNGRFGVVQFGHGAYHPKTTGSE